MMEAYIGRLGYLGPLLFTCPFLSPAGLKPSGMVLSRLWLLMASNHGNWNILSWNVMGLSRNTKWNDIRDKIESSACAIFCFQETKRTAIDLPFLHNFSSKRYNNFAYHPSIVPLVVC